MNLFKNELTQLYMDLLTNTSQKDANIIIDQMMDTIKKPEDISQNI